MAARMSICGEKRGLRNQHDEFHHDINMQRAYKESEETKDIEDKKRKLVDANNELAVAQAILESKDHSKTYPDEYYEKHAICTYCNKYEKVSAARLEPRSSNL